MTALLLNTFAAEIKISWFLNLIWMKIARVDGDLTYEEKKVKLNNLVDLYLRTNSHNKYDVLLLLYFAKNHWLEIVEDNKSTEGIELTHILTRDFHQLIDYDLLFTRYVNELSVFLKIPEDIYNKPGMEECISSMVSYSHYAVSSVFNTLDSNGYRLYVANFFNLVNVLMDMPDDFYEIEFTDIFNLLLEKVTLYGSREGGEFIQSSRITDLVLSLLDVKDGSMYNPYAGFCSYGARLKTSVNYVGQEINRSVSLLGNLNLIANNKENSTCYCEDSVQKWRGGEGYDYIVASPYFGRFKDEMRNTNFHESFYLANSAIDCLKKSAGVFSIAMCNKERPEYKKVRQLIVDNDWIESVIEIPSEKSRTASLFIFIINKHKERRGLVRFFDASEYFFKERYDRILNVDSIIDLYRSFTNNDIFCDVSINDIRSSDYNLYPKFYINSIWFKNRSFENLVSLRSILTPIERKCISQSSDVFLFRGSVAKSKIISASELRNVKENSIKEFPIFNIVDEDCLLLSRSSIYDRKTPSLYYIKTEGHEVAFKIPTMLYRVDISSVIPEYFIKESEKDYFVKQLMRYGTFVSNEEFLDCVIELPSLLEQRAALVEYEDVRLKEEKENLENIYKQRFDDFKKGQRQRKHAVGQVLNELYPSIEKINRFLNNNDVVSKNSLISKSRGITLGQMMESVSEQVQRIVSMVDNFTSDEKYGTPETINVSEFISGYCQTKNSDDRFSTTFVCDDSMSKELEVSISRNDLTQIFDNLFTNACKYGFVDKDRKNYEIRINTSYSDNGNEVLISIANNGVPASDSIDKEKIFAWGAGHGTGIGCWQVKDIAEHFGGTATYNEYPDASDGFVCEFVITLPLK